MSNLVVPDILPNLNTTKWGGEVWIVKGQPTFTDMGSGRFGERR